jgi:hypothetical protein
VPIAETAAVVLLVVYAAQWNRLDLRPILVPVLVVFFLSLLLGFLAYKFRCGHLMGQMRTGVDKKGPPGAEREVTLVLTDVQVS